MSSGKGRAGSDLARVVDSLLDGAFNEGEAFRGEGRVAERCEEFVQIAGPRERIGAEHRQPFLRVWKSFADEVEQRGCFHAETRLSQRLDAGNIGVNEKRFGSRGSMSLVKVLGLVESRFAFTAGDQSADCGRDQRKFRWLDGWILLRPFRQHADCSLALFSGCLILLACSGRNRKTKVFPSLDR